MPSLNGTENKEPLKIITINIPEKFVELFETMVNWGLFPSRSEAVRECIMMAYPTLLAQMKQTDLLLELGDRKLIKRIHKWVDENGFVLVKKGESSLKKMRKNVWWDEYELINGETIRVPRDPEEVEAELNGDD